MNEEIEKQKSIKIRVPAKWVLSGEHSVLRGYSALAFPYEAFSLTVIFKPLDFSSGLVIQNTDHEGSIRALINRALAWLGTDQGLQGKLKIESTIPMSSGLGSSAALCVALAKLVLMFTHRSLDQTIALATHLEDVFHGKSSGMDVSAIALAQPILYSMEKRVEILEISRRPPSFQLQDSGKRGQTRQCIESVQQWQKTFPEKVSEYDQRMGEATRLASRALRSFEFQPKEALAELVQAMNLAQSCFEVWGLVDAELLEQKNKFLSEGALAVKLTGAGLGGFWVVLWPENQGT